MRKSSLTMSTARGVALLRAVEGTRPESDRLLHDPYARRFIDPLRYHLSAGVIRSGVMDRLVFGGTIAFALLREVHVEAVMAAELAAGASQLVILGAGYDTRAYRLAGAAGRAVFEVDHPITQAGKRDALARQGAQLPSRHAFVAVDFNTDDLGERLRSAGYDPAARTLFVWQGVTMYLTPAGVDATLGFVAGNAAAGSPLVFDYFHRPRHGRSEKRLAAAMKAMGEPFTFGLDPHEIGPFLAERGFAMVEDVGGEDLKRRYARGIHLNRPVATNAGIVTARVKGP